MASHLSLKSLFTEEVYKPGYKIKPFLISMLLFGLGFGLMHGAQDNYLAEIAHVSKFERGIVEFFREMPGLLLIFILAAMYKLSESRIFKTGLAICLAGVAGLAVFSQSKFIIIFFLVVFNLGEHIMVPVKNSISVEGALENKGGLSLGITKSLDNLGRLTGYLLVSLFFFIIGKKTGTSPNSFSYRMVFALSTAVIALAFLFSISLKETNIKGTRPRVTFLKKYNTYYILEIFYGARKQVFLTFAPYVLILQYGATAYTMSLLLALTSVGTFLFGPLIGKLIDKVGYKLVMVVDTLFLVFVCFLYGYSHLLFPPKMALFLVCFNYVLDSIISLASMASSLYAKDLSSSQEEFTSTLSTGISLNHLISVLIALTGGIIWQKIGSEVLFTMSAILGIFNSIFAATIKIDKKREALNDF